MISKETKKTIKFWSILITIIIITQAIAWTVGIYVLSRL